MSMFNSYLLCAVVLFCAVLVASAPSPDPLEFKTDLTDATNNAVCPIEVVYSEDINRIPRRIKMLKCATKPNPVCRHSHMAHACCHHHHEDFSTQCAEVIDYVTVKNNLTQTYEVIPVSVGCSCMIRMSKTAKVDPLG